ncbi:MAG: cytochrome oxidase maturation protein cbb3-type [Alphaproteobacteria bacterium]|jgi:cbb3-type cytochrome oxidase maturation protein|nr:cytochrome oxidase maturation protein cbb3-type [Alphaproteobacteria bacterium]
MSSLIYLVPLALLLGGAALAAFLWSLRSGQYEDLDGAAHRIFLEDDGDRAGGGPDSGATARAEPNDSMPSSR